MQDISGYEDLFLKNNGERYSAIMGKSINRCYLGINHRLRKLNKEYLNSTSALEKNQSLVMLLNAYEESFLWRVIRWKVSFLEDVKQKLKYGKYRTRIDNSDPHALDYYSVALIVKNEARYMREYMLFYKATGADRIYLYDNDSTDNLMEVIEPFVSSGFVIYQKWPGERVQYSAYRDAIRRTSRRSKWLALVDADEFLYSLKGSMKEQLKGYESYPAVGVNWFMFGPNGHDKRPSGLVIENYTSMIADEDTMVNRHIKSIVRPGKVFTIQHPHFAFYKGREYAVDENKNPIDNTAAFYVINSRAFTVHNHGEVFRINHYYTRSLEDVREKCARGFPDGQPNNKYESMLEKFDCPLKEDRTIQRYLDIVKADY